MGYDPGKFITYAKFASDAGSMLGKTIYGRHLMEGQLLPRDEKRGLALLEEAVAAGHSHAVNHLADLMLIAASDGDTHGVRYALVKPDREEALKLLSSVKDKGALTTIVMRGIVKRYGWDGPEDFNGFVRDSIEYVELSDSAEYSNLLHVFGTRRNFREVRGLFTPEQIEKYRTRRKEAMELGDPDSLNWIAGDHIFYMRPNIGVPSLLRSCNLGSHRGIFYAVSLMRRGMESDNDGVFDLSGERDSAHAAAIDMYESGRSTRDFGIMASYAYAISKIERDAPRKVKGEGKAIPVMRDIIALYPGDKFHYHNLAYHLITLSKGGDNERQAYDRVCAIFCYWSEADATSLHYLHWYHRPDYVFGGKFFDPVKSIAVGWEAVKRNTGKKKADSQKFVAQVEKDLTDEQREAAKKLSEDGYPTAKKYRMEAFEFLKASGDIPKDAVFDDRSGASLAAPATTAMLCKADAAPTSESVLEQYLDGEPLDQPQLDILTSLLLGDEDSLRELLAQQKDERKEPAETMIEVLENVTDHSWTTEASGAGFGWYLLIRDKKFTSIPLVSIVEKGSAGEKAGLKVADVVDRCNGIELKNEDSRNRFVRLLRLWPIGTPITLDVRRSNKPIVKDIDTSFKGVKKTVTFIPRTDGLD